MGQRDGESTGQVCIEAKKVDVSTFVSILFIIPNSAMSSLIVHAWCFGELQCYPGARQCLFSYPVLPAGFGHTWI